MNRLIQLASLLFALLAATVWVPLAAGANLSERKLEEVTVRGRRLADYIRSVRAVAEVIRQESSRAVDDSQCLAEQTSAGWVVVVGQLNEKNDEFLARDSAIVQPTKSPAIVAKLNLTFADHAFFNHAARAKEVVLQEVGADRGKYEVIALPADNGQWYIYLLPRQIVPERYEFGHDIRYLVSSDGSSVLARHWMHKSLIEFKESERNGKISAGFHSHALSDDPEDSDVSYVLLRKPSLPEFIKTPNHAYVVRADGTILCEQ